MHDTNDSPSGHPERDAAPQPERFERPERAERPARPERTHRPDRSDRSDRPDRSDRSDRPGRPPRQGQGRPGSGQSLVESIMELDRDIIRLLAKRARLFQKVRDKIGRASCRERV